MLFDEIKDLKQSIHEIRNNNLRDRVLLGKITHINKTNGFVRVIDSNNNTNYASDWLRPSSIMFQLKDKIRVNMFCLYGYIENTSGRKGYYFSIVNPEASIDTGGDIPEGFATEDYVDAAIAALDTSVDASIASIQTDLDNNYYTKTESDTNYYTKTQTDTAIRAFRQIPHIYTQASGAAQLNCDVPSGWKSAQIYVVNATYPYPLNGATQRTEPILNYQFNAANNGGWNVNDFCDFLINTTSRVIMRGQDGIIMAGAANGSFAMNMGTRWRVQKIAGTSYSLTNLGGYLM